MLDCRQFIGSATVVFLALSWGLQAPHLALGQTTCGATSTLQVQDQEGIETLKAAVNCSGGGNVTVVWSGALMLNDPIVIASGTSLSVTGEDDSAEALAGGQTRLFEVSSGGSLSLNGMIVSGGSAGLGGAIFSDSGTVALNSCVLDGNSASAGSGGAVWVDQGALTVSGGEFSDNTASSYGGSIYALDTTLVIQDGSSFSGNRGIRGGAVFCGGSGSTIASCSLSGAKFVSNIASDGAEKSDDSSGRGGAAAFRFASVDVEDCLFEANYAPIWGGALHGDNDTDMTVTGCTFSNNTTSGDGAAMSASSVVIGGGTKLVDNYADGNGGGVFGWNEAGLVVLNDVQCLNNSAGENGGCLYVAGKAVINNGTVMLGNAADLGGCAYGDGGSKMTITGGTFTQCHSSDNGGFLFASDGSVVTVTGGNITDNTSDGRGAAIYCSGNSFNMGGSEVTITGGNFVDNEALEHGGAIAAWGGTTVLLVEGGTFVNNTARYYGGFVFLEELASMNCSGATLRENYAGDQGGAIYARDAESVSSSCDLVGNESPQGAAAYLTHVFKGATFENVSVTNNVASGGSVLFVAQSSVILTGVTFEASVALQEDSSNRAVQLDEGSTLFGDGCTFVGWIGDTVIHSKNAKNGSLVLNSCDFRGNFASMMVVSPYSDAEIRNAIVDETTLTNVVVENGSAVLVDNALNCSDAGACDASGACVDSNLGVLCVCIDDDSPCLTDGGTLLLALETFPESVTYSPDKVSFELLVSAADDGTTYAIWDLNYEAEDLDLEVTPSSGVLPPGDAVTVTVTGTPNKDDVGGNLTSIFTLPPVGSSSSSTSSSDATAKIEVNSTFYLCYAYQYDVPQNEEEDRCQQCVNIDDADGVDCDEPGATLSSLPIKSGYWRSSKESVAVLECIYSGACAGATQVSSSDDYCSTGYEGPYCALCASGYGRSVGNICHSCEDTSARFLIAAGALFFLVILLVLAFTAVFLVGGLDAVGSMRRSAAKTLNMGTHKARVFWSHSLQPGTSFRRPKPRDEPVRRETTREALDRSFAYNEGLEGDRRLHRDVAAAGGKSKRATFPVSMSPAVSHDATPDVLLGQNVDGTSVGFESGRQSLSLLMDRNLDSSTGRTEPRGFGERVKRFWSRIPLDKLKILVVVWQILTVFPSITAVDFPPVYSRFLSWIDIFNLDLVRFFSASCVFPGMNFYERLLVTTLAPILLCGMLAVTFTIATSRAGIGSAGVVAIRAARSRHMAAGLLLTFLVFTSASTVIFKTFGCDKTVIEGESYLRADYSLSCKTTTHTMFEIYAGFMLLVYPIGIPLLYAFILWKNRHLLNPKLAAVARVEEERQAEMSGTGEFISGEDDGIAGNDPSAESEEKKPMSRLEQEEMDKMVELRRTQPELVPSMFLWKDFGPDLYYYEVIECGRRILLTGVLIFIKPYTPTQAAAACIFAFASLLGFELLRPHLDPADSWLYRLGCVVIFLSNFLALLIKVDAAGEGNGAALGGLLVAVNLMLVVAVIATSWFSTQQEVDDARDDEDRYSLAMNMINADRIAVESARPVGERKFWPSEASSTATAPRFVGVAADKTELFPQRSRGRDRISATMVEEMWEHDREQNAQSR